MKIKKNLIKLISESGSNHYYVKKKSKNYKKILKLKKFDPIKKNHFIYKEEKLN